MNSVHVNDWTVKLTVKKQGRTTQSIPMCSVHIHWHTGDAPPRVHFFSISRIFLGGMAQIIGWWSSKILIAPLVLFAVQHHAKAHRKSFQ